MEERRARTNNEPRQVVSVLSSAIPCAHPRKDRRVQLTAKASMGNFCRSAVTSYRTSSDRSSMTVNAIHHLRACGPLTNAPPQMCGTTIAIILCSMPGIDADGGRARTGCWQAPGGLQGSCRRYFRGDFGCYLKPLLSGLAITPV